MAGWTLYGPQQKFDETTVISGQAGADGMCRPLGYNYFVFYKGQFAGTISPSAMNSREDGSATFVHLEEQLSLAAEFSRYADKDPLCCPSRTSFVTYRIQFNPNGPMLVAESVNTSK
jgi:hypothetical protein